MFEGRTWPPRRLLLPAGGDELRASGLTAAACRPDKRSEDMTQASSASDQRQRPLRWPQILSLPRELENSKKRQMTSDAPSPENTSHIIIPNA
jgi:hypothetical protein